MRYSDFVTKSGVFAAYQNFSLSPWNLQEVTPNILKQNLCFFTQNFNIYSRTQSCNGNKLTPMCFLLNSPSHTLAKYNDCYTILSIYDAFIFAYKVYLHHITLL